MHHQRTQVDDALDSLGDRRWPGDYNNPELKENLMQKFDTNRASRGLGRRGTLLAALAILTVSSVGFAAAGGVQMIQGWFITVEVNGEPVDFDEDAIQVESHGDGTVTLTVDGEALGIEGGEEGDEATITIIANEADAAAIIITDEDGNTTEIRKSGTENNAEDE